MYLFVCVKKRESLVSITQKHIIARSSKFALYIHITWRCYLKFFTKINQIVYAQDTQTNSNRIWYMDGIPFLCILLCFGSSKFNKMNIPFSYIKNMLSTENGMNIIHSFLTGPHKRIWKNWRIWLKSAGVLLKFFYVVCLMSLFYKPSCDAQQLKKKNYIRASQNVSKRILFYWVFDKMIPEYLN